MQILLRERSFFPTRFAKNLSKQADEVTTWPDHSYPQNGCVEVFLGMHANEFSSLLPYVVTVNMRGMGAL